MGKLSILIQGMKQKIHIFGKSCKNRGVRYDSQVQCRGRSRKINAAKNEKKVLREKWKTNVTKVVSPDAYAQCG